MGDRGDGGARLVVVCGVGVPSAPLAQATADAARAQGLVVRSVVTDEIDTVDGLAGSPWHEVLAAAVTALGAATVPVAAAGLSDGRRAAALAHVLAAAADPAVDLVVVDAGDQRSARDLAAHPGAVGALLAAMQGPALAMGSSDDAGGAFDRLTAARSVVERAIDALTGPATVWRVAVPPRATSVPDVWRAFAALVVLGARIDGLVLDEYPRKSAAADVRADAAAAQAELELGTAVRVWRGGADRRAVPKDAPVAGPAGPVAMLVPRDPLGDDQSWEWALALPRPVIGRVRVGVADERLVLESDGAYGWLDLPPVLRRTHAVEAFRDSGGLLVRFRPDPAVWPSSGPSGSDAADAREAV